jgi:sodium transport system permease protein
MLVIVVPLSLMTSSLLLVVSAFARNQKEAQAYIVPFMVLIMLPTALLSGFVSQDPPFGYSLVPILNTALVMKKVLVGTFDWPFLCTAIVSSGVYAALAMKVATVMFEKESVLFRA